MQSDLKLHNEILAAYSDIAAAGADEMTRQDFPKDLSNAIIGMQDVFGDSDLLPSDEALRTGLDPLDFNELQMLTDSTIVTEETENSFRLDRL